MYSTSIDGDKSDCEKDYCDHHLSKESIIKSEIKFETDKEYEARIRKESPFGSMHTFKVFKIIVKSNDDIR